MKTFEKFLKRRRTATLAILPVLTCPFGAAGQQPGSRADTSAAQTRLRISLERQVASAHRTNASVDRQKASARRQTGSSALAFDWSAPLPIPADLPPLCDPLPASRVENLVQTASRSEGVDADLIRGVMKEESGFRPCAVSPRGAMGLMQLMPATATDLVVSDPFDPAENVTAGAKLLRRLMLQYGGDLALTLAAYNAGPARVAGSMTVPQIPETIDYVRNIIGLLSDRKPNAWSVTGEAEEQ